MIRNLISDKGLQGMIDRATYAKLQAEKTVTYEYRNLLYNMFHDVVAGTPQWSGNLATNWGIEILGAPKVRYREHPAYMHSFFSRLAVHKMGDDPAVRDTLNRELPKLNNLKWNSKVTFVNRTPYADDVSRGIGPEATSAPWHSAAHAKHLRSKKGGARRPIRDVNLDSAGQVVMLNGIRVKYQNLYGVTIN